jgi:hypothetical protein
MDVQRPSIPLLCGRYVPADFAGRATAYLPNKIRFPRNVALYLVALECLVSIASLPLAAARGNLGKASTGIHGVLAVVSAVGIFGLLKLQRPMVLLHAMLAIGIPVVFGLFMIFTLTLSQGIRDSADAIVILIFISLFFDVFAGLASSFALFRMNVYYQQCKRADNAPPVIPASNPVVAVMPMPNDDVIIRLDTDAGLAHAGTVEGRQARARGLQELVTQGGIVPAPNAFTSAATQGNIHVPVPGGILDEGQCIICMERPRNTAFFPCGHMACQQCATTVQRGTGRCHICRRGIRDSLRIYT